MQSQKKITLFNLPYPYGKRQIYLPSALITVGAAFQEMGFDVAFVDLNVTGLNDPETLTLIHGADYVGTSLVESPNIPDTIRLIENVRNINPFAQFLVGGQVVEGLTQEQFSTIFGSFPIQVTQYQALKEVIGIQTLPDITKVSCAGMYELLPQGLLKEYLSREGGLFISQGCHYACKFCGAAKGRPEQYREMSVIEKDLRYLAKTAKEFGLKKLQFYLSNLDIFQNPKKLFEFLHVVDKVDEDAKVLIRVRGLSCIASFIAAQRMIPNFEETILRGNLFEIGFGFDGTDRKIWLSQNKRHNLLSMGDQAIKDCKRFGIDPQLLMVFGFPEDSMQTLIKTVWYSISKCLFKGATARPYLAKPFIPKNDGWGNPEFQAQINRVIQNPSLFYNLDFCSLGSKLTHPRWWHRWLANLSYLLIILILTPFKKNTTFPLIPQGDLSPWKILVNKLMPFDR